MGRSNLRLNALIASGGMAEVYEGFLTDENGFEKRVAVKKMLEKFSLDEKHRESFRREAKITSKLNNPNIGQVFDFIDEDQQLLIVCELLEGITLDEYLKRRSELDFDINCLIAYRSVDALLHAHTFSDPTTKESLTILHRDISPHNVMLTIYGEVKIIDFGISKTQTPEKSLTATNFLAGKLSYLAPELFDGSKASRETDIYAVGAVLFELFSGTHPFEGAADVDTLSNIKIASRPKIQDFNSAVDRGLARLVEKCIALKPSERTGVLEELKLFFEENVAITPKIQERLKKEVTKFRRENKDPTPVVDRTKTSFPSRSSSMPFAKSRRLVFWLSAFVGLAFLMFALFFIRARVGNSKVGFRKGILLELEKDRSIELLPPEAKLVENGAIGFGPDEHSCYDLCLNVGVEADLVLSGRIFTGYDPAKAVVPEYEFANRIITPQRANYKILPKILGPCTSFQSVKAVCDAAINLQDKSALATASLIPLTTGTFKEIQNEIRIRALKAGIDVAPFDWDRVSTTIPPNKMKSVVEQYGFDEKLLVMGVDGFDFTSLKTMPSNTYECNLLASSILAKQMRKNALAGGNLVQKDTDLMLVPRGSMEYLGVTSSDVHFRSTDKDLLEKFGICRFRINSDGSARSAFWIPKLSN